MRLFPVLVVASLVCGCGALTPGKDAGVGGGGGSLFGGGVGGGTGGGTTGGGTGGGTTGGGTTGGGTTGGGTTGGGTGTGGGSAALAWTSIGIGGSTSTSYVIALTGSATDLWAAQDTGPLFHSTGGAFTFQFSFQYGVKDLYASGGTVVMIQTRAIRTCTSGCTHDADFQQLDLLNSGMNWNLFGEAVCGTSPTNIVAVVSDTNNRGQLFEWHGSSWVRTNTNLPIDNPTHCWFDDAGHLYISGEDAVVYYDQGAATPVALSNNFTSYTSGAFVGGSAWVVGPYDYVAKGAVNTFTPVTLAGAGQLLHAVGGLSATEVFAFGYYTSTNRVGNGYRWNGTALSPVGDLIPGFGSGSTVRVVHVTGPNELYVAGGDGSGPLVARARR